MTALTVLGAALLGALTWTFMEYCIHRWLGHRWKRNVFGKEHTRHHSEGDYFAATPKKLGAASLFLAVTAPPAIWVAGALAGGAWAVGLVGFYGYYEWLHRRAHTHGPRNAYGRWVRRHHFHHHFGDPRMNHGVTSPLWDAVFGTLQEPGQIRVPRKLCMVWLKGPDGEIPPAFQADYALRGR
ncbi:MAG: sterol desaturase family protein [Myxococcales bacterium]|nr:sterol desaturase family protein [Myxococcales bacterium]MCB9524291.1 sterol desaturase family protein [Myxococcales bacterium]